MKSPCCKHEIVIQTDPKNCEYLVMSGGTKKVEEYDVEDAETFELPPDEGRLIIIIFMFYFISACICSISKKLYKVSQLFSFLQPLNINKHELVI